MRRKALFLCSLLFLSLFPPVELRRGGGGSLGGSRGSSGSRASSGSFGRGGSSSRGSSSGGGIFGGGSKTGVNRNEYSRGTNFGQNRGSATSSSSNNGGGWNSNSNSGSNWKGNRGNVGGSKGGLFSGFGSRSGSRWTNSGMGSRSRGSQFKNMIVGAAAGYLTYQAGKAIIRAAAGPMMWNNRPYYWGSNYYRSSPGHTNMCRMPIESGDPQFGNVYFSDQSRPHEITWGCGYYEYCCGYECCRGGGASGYRRSSIGYALVVTAVLVRRMLF